MLYRPTRELPHRRKARRAMFWESSDIQVGGFMPRAPTACPSPKRTTLEPGRGNAHCEHTVLSRRPNLAGRNHAERAANWVCIGGRGRGRPRCTARGHERGANHRARARLRSRPQRPGRLAPPPPDRGYRGGRPVRRLRRSSFVHDGGTPPSIGRSEAGGSHPGREHAPGHRAAGARRDDRVPLRGRTYAAHGNRRRHARDGCDTHAHRGPRHGGRQQRAIRGAGRMELRPDAVLHGRDLPRRWGQHRVRRARESRSDHPHRPRTDR